VQCMNSQLSIVNTRLHKNLFQISHYIIDAEDLTIEPRCLLLFHVTRACRTPLLFPERIHSFCKFDNAFSKNAIISVILSAFKA
jgi:hypothetical protein